ncbi:MAG: Com family DNA-binding transcriptional regulator [Candidatus Protistobacter heckmanni]|nr:Com family DNA-binding transcriptional regulator [Candidatus Protistobacter heckmanni]MCS6764865.1 Com family DNA-binding transcriptional regulator [Candidatus Protistobacter heckmanni]
MAEVEYTRIRWKCPRCGSMNEKAVEPHSSAPRAPEERKTDADVP